MASGIHKMGWTRVINSQQSDVRHCHDRAKPTTNSFCTHKSDQSVAMSSRYECRVLAMIEKWYFFSIFGAALERGRRTGSCISILEDSDIS